jgi:hypothetical protein
MNANDDNRSQLIDKIDHILQIQIQREESENEAAAAYRELYL